MCDPCVMSEHKREKPRVPIEIRVEYKRVNAFISDFTRDISGTGLFIRTDHPLEIGELCLFTLQVPGLAAITLRGAVRRVVLTPGEGSEPGMGVELLFDDDEERQALTNLVDSLMVEHLGNALYQRLVRLRGQG